MDISTITSSFAGQMSSMHSQSAQNEIRRTNLDSNNSQAAVVNNIGANNSQSPTVNTNGQTVGRLINVTA